MLLSARIDGGMEFHKMGPLWLILNRFMLVFTDSIGDSCRMIWCRNDGFNYFDKNFL